MLNVTRHAELFVPSGFRTPIHVIGCGATGSWVVLQLAKLGISGELINVWDFDTVEEHNVPNQLFYARSDIGMPKVKAAWQHVMDATGSDIRIHEKEFTSQRISGYVFLMVDSMRVRKEIWENSIKMKSAIKHLIEPRMGLDVGRVYNVNPTSIAQIKAYEDTYYDDDTAEVSACGASMSVITTAMSVAATCVRQLINHHNGIELHNEILLDFKYNNLLTEKWEG